MDDRVVAGRGVYLKSDTVCAIRSDPNIGWTRTTGPSIARCDIL